jgi:hypothetical protein
MKPKYDLELEDWGPPAKSRYMKIFIICLIVVVIVGFFTGIGIFASMIGRCIGSLFAGIGEALSYVFLPLFALAYAIWVGLTVDWALFVWLFFVLLGWLLSVGLL